MKKRDLAKILILTITTISVNTSYAIDTELLLETENPPTVSVEKHSSSIESATVNVSNGMNQGPSLMSAFTLRTNGTDDDYDFVMTAAIQKDSGMASGYAQIGGKTVLLFGNTENLPTDSDIADVRAAGSHNCNVIAYPLTIIPPSPMTATYNSNYSTYGECIVIKLNGAKSGTLTQSVNASPMPNSYIIGQDTAGIYRSVVTFTATSKL